MLTIQNELYLLYLASACYVLFSISLILNENKFYKPIVSIGILGLLIHTASITIHWVRVGHGPFINLYEILNSNVWSLFFAFILFMLFFRDKLYIAKMVLPVIVILLLWLLVTDAADTYLPPTYNTIWLYFHVVAGKLYFSLLLISTGLASYSLIYSVSTTQYHSNVSLAYKFLTMAFVFDSFMLFFGAIWAQDAWGRYWSWDPLETWAFLSWLSIVFILHLQLNRNKARIFCSLIILSFLLAFLTFFGVPFISTAAHQGMV